MADQDDAPKIQIDSDWKAQAQAEKQRLAEDSQKKKEAQGDNAQPAGQGGMPSASFETLISTLATQALFAMGAIPDPATGQRMQHLELARHHIDMLGILEDKTKNNLSEEESDMLVQTTYELRQRYIQLSSAARP